jgi:adenylate cyclase
MSKPKTQRRPSRLLRTADLVALMETGSDLAAEVNLDTLLTHILSRASNLTDSPDTSVILYKEDTKSLYFAAATGAKANYLLATWGEFSVKEIPLHGSKAGEVFRTGHSLVVNAMAKEPRHFKGVDRDTKKDTESMVCVPLTIADKRLGVMQVLNKPSGGYTDHDRVLLEQFSNQAAVAIRNAQLFESLLAHMGFYASRDRSQGPLELLKELSQPARQETMSVLFADMRGFTQLCELQHDPKVTQQLLNEFLTMLAKQVIVHQGVVNKFLGDGLLALFRAEKEEVHAQRSVRAAFGMVSHFSTLLKQWNNRTNLDLDFLDIGIGIVTDKVIVGTIRSGQVRDFTAIGTPVNLANYLENQARGGKRILVDKRTYLAARDIIADFEGPEKIELKKPNYDVAHRYVQYQLKSLRGQLPIGPEEAARIGTAASESAPSIFVSYSHQDKEWLSRLRTHLRPYERDKKISYWDDTKIKAGARWREEIKKALGGARVAVLLVSPDFLASEFITMNELPPLLKAGENDGLRVLWVPVRASAFTETEIYEYQAVCDPEKPLSSLNEAEQDQTLVNISRKIVESARV